jgi:hypothetical protein
MVSECSLWPSAVMDDDKEAAKGFWGICHGRSHKFQSQLDGIESKHWNSEIKLRKKNVCRATKELYDTSKCLINPMIHSISMKPSIVNSPQASISHLVRELPSGYGPTSANPVMTTTWSRSIKPCRWAKSCRELLASSFLLSKGNWLAEAHWQFGRGVRLRLR